MIQSKVLPILLPIRLEELPNGCPLEVVDPGNLLASPASVAELCEAQGMIIRAVGDGFTFCPPFSPP